MMIELASISQAASDNYSYNAVFVGGWLYATGTCSSSYTCCSALLYVLRVGIPVIVQQLSASELSCLLAAGLVGNAQNITGYWSWERLHSCFILLQREILLAGHMECIHSNEARTWNRISAVPLISLRGQAARCCR